MIRRIHLECGFYEFMIRFWICLKKPKIRFGFGNPDLHFPKKNAPKVRCLWSQLWLAAAKLDALVKAAFTLQGSGVIEKRSNELFFIIWIKCFYEFFAPHTDVNKHKMHFSFIFSIYLNVWGQNAHITNVSGKRAVCIRNSRLLITLWHKITPVPWLHVQWNPVDTVTSGPKKFGRINWWSCYLGGRKAGFRYYLAVGNFYI